VLTDEAEESAGVVRIRYSPLPLRLQRGVEFLSTRCCGVVVVLPKVVAGGLAFVLFVEGEGMLVDVDVLRCEGLGFHVVFRRCILVLGQGDAGCIPGRRATSDWIFPFLGMGCYCGSNQSYGEKAFFLVVGCCFLSSGSTVGFGFGVGVWQRTASSASTVGTRDLLVIFCLCRVLCASWVGCMSLLYPSRAYLFCPMYVYVFIELIQVCLIKKRGSWARTARAY